MCEPDLEEEGAVIADKEEVSSEPVQSLSRRASSGTAACRLENDFEQPITGLVAPFCFVFAFCMTPTASESWILIPWRTV